MNSGAFIAIYLPLFVMIIASLDHSKRLIKTVIRKRRKKRGFKEMTNELFNELIGTTCNIMIGSSLGSSYSKVKVLEVSENWIKVEKKEKLDYINIDYIQAIKVIES